MENNIYFRNNRGIYIEVWLYPWNVVKFSMAIFKSTDIMNVNERKERQSHGFINETRVKLEHGLFDYDGEANSYTNKYDAQTLDGVPVSIKTEKLKSDIELGDYFRNAQANEDFYMSVSFWESEKDNIVEEYHVRFPIEEWRKLFNHTLDNKIRKVIREASNDRSYDATWTEKINELKREYGNNVIRLRPKRDHKKQKKNAVCYIILGFSVIICNL
jgi:hypothetical protein